MKDQKENVFTKSDLKTMQGWSLQRKIQVTQTRIFEWQIKHKNNIYVSFSGGKDSTVLLDLARRVMPDIPSMFVDTGLEYPEIKEFVASYHNVDIKRPEMPFHKVIQKYGYPVISKETAKNIDYGRKAKLHGDQKMYDYYINGHRHNKKTGKDYIFMPLPQMWHPLLESDIPVSNRCCQIMKKNPAKLYEKETGLHPIIGEMADDSKEREMNYLRSGCNAFNTKRPISKPMGFWTEQDVLEYIYMTQLPICSVYGDVVLVDGKYKTTGVNRTGCIFCMFGCHLQDEPNKFQQLNVTHPQLHDYCIRPVENKGLGIGKVLDFIDVKYS